MNELSPTPQHPEAPNDVPSLGWFELWFAAPSILLVCILALPVVAVVVRAGTTGLTVDSVATKAFALSLYTSSLSLVLIFITGTPLAYVLVKHKFWGKAFVELLIDLPLVLPPAAAGLALLAAFGRRGLLGEALNNLGLALPFTTWAVIVAQTFVASPLYVRAARLGFAHISKPIWEAATVEGASAWHMFRYIMLPLSARAIVSGLVLTWLRALGEFGATILFAGNLEGVTQTMPLAIYLGFERDFNLALALTAFFILACSVFLIALRFLEKEDETTHTP